MSRFDDERVPFPSPWRLRRELRLRRPPWWMFVMLLLIVVLTWIPLWIVYQVRGTDSPVPKVRIFQDMAVQPSYGPQATSDLFADGRAMRSPVAGTVARGQLNEDDHFHRGFTAESSADGHAINYFDTLPDLPLIGAAVLDRGRAMYQAHCAVCHGDDARGDSVLNQWATLNQMEGWVPASSLVDDPAAQQPAGYLFHVIGHGKGNMPAFASRIAAKDRWAIVAYLLDLRETSGQTNPITSPEE